MAGLRAGHFWPLDPPDPSLLVLLWGTDYEMGRAEVEALARTPFLPLGRGLVAGSCPDHEVLRRLGYARSVLRCLGRSGGPAPPFDPTSVISGSFAVRVHMLAGASDGPSERAVAADIGAGLWRRLPYPRVDLRRPDVEVHVFVTEHGYWWGELLFVLDRAGFEARRPHRRPFWRSIAMPPRKARCMVNLSGVHPGGTLLDPFCGTGTVPIEAALVGVRTYASDIDRIVAAGAARNFAALGLADRIDLRPLDAREWGDLALGFDAIVSDLPYGHSASVRGVDRDELYRTFIDAATRVLVPGGRAVLMLPHGALPPPPTVLILVASFLEFVHGSLTREVVVLQKYPPHRVAGGAAKSGELAGHEEGGDGAGGGAARALQAGRRVGGHRLVWRTPQRVEAHPRSVKPPEIRLSGRELP